MANPLPIFGFDTTYPTSGTWQAGQVVLNSGATEAGNPLGWACITAGASGGTWKPIGALADLGLTTVTAAAALSAGYRVYQITAAGPYTLMSAASYGAGFEIAINTTGAVTLVAASSQTLVGDNTIAANAAMRWTSDGVQYWVRTS